MNVLIIGGGTLGSNIADRLLNQDEFQMVFRSSKHQVTFIEQDEEQVEKLAQSSNVPIFHGDGTKQEVLKQVVPEKMDVAIAATNSDQQNSIIALQAKRMGINHVIAVARDPSYISLLEDSGVVCISVPFATAAKVTSYLEGTRPTAFFEIVSGVASLIKIKVAKNAAVVTRMIQDIDIPDLCVIAAIIRDDLFVIPRGETKIQPEDHVVFVGPSEAIQAAHETFSKSTSC